jgi:hypothetical protein
VRPQAFKLNFEGPRPPAARARAAEARSLKFKLSGPARSGPDAGLPTVRDSRPGVGLRLGAPAGPPPGEQ